jgi:serine/threonine protein kinase
VVENSPWQPGYVLDGRYELVKLVGSGGMGVVWRVFDREWDRDLALKLPRPVVLESPTLRERYVREAETWIGLGVHPHIVQCWFVSEVHGVPALFLDYLTGGSLASWIDEGHVRPGQWDLIIEIAMQVAEGLAYAHSKGVVHRDVKPENLLIRGDERVCVTDFGLVKTAVSESVVSDSRPSGAPGCPGDAGMTGAGAYLGTPMYGAPEQWGAAEKVGPPADIYALGVTLYEMCCGRRPFDSSEEEVAPMDLIRRHLSNQAPDPREFYPDVPPELASLCLSMLSKDPAQRPSQMTAVRESLRAIHERLSSRTFRPAAPLLGVPSPDVLNNQAVSLFSLGKLTEAVETLRRGLGIDPGHPECLYNLVQLEKRHGRIGHLEALRRLKQARAYYPLALLSIEEGMPAEALEILKEIKPQELSSPGLIHRATGDAYMYLGQHAVAEQAYAQAQELMPKDALAEQRRRLAAAGTGKEPGGAIYFPSSEPLRIDHGIDPGFRLLLDARGEGMLAVSQELVLYRSFAERAVPVKERRCADCGRTVQVWIHGRRLVIADSRGFEYRRLPGLELLLRREGRVLACAPRLDRMVTLEQSGPQLLGQKEGQRVPIAMEGQSPHLGPLLAAFDAQGTNLRLLLPSGHLAALDEQARAIPQAWPPRVDGHRQARCLALACDGMLVVGLANGTVRGYNLGSQRIEFSVTLSEPPVSLEIAAGAPRVVVRTRHGFFVLSRSGETLLAGEGPLALDPQGRRALFFFQGHQVMYNLAPLHVLRRWSRVMEEPLSLAFSGDGRLAVSMSMQGESLVWEMDEPHRVYQRQLLMSPGRSYADILNADERFRDHMTLARQAAERGESLESHRHLQRARRVPGYGQGAEPLDFAWSLLDTLKRDQLEAVWERLSVEGVAPGDLDLSGDGGHLLFSFGQKAFLAVDQAGGARPLWTQSRSGPIRLLRFVRTHDRQSVLVADQSGEVSLHNPQTGRRRLAFALEGGGLAQANLQATVLTYLSPGGGLGQLDLGSGVSVFRNDFKSKPRFFAPWRENQILLATGSAFGLLDLSRPGTKLQALRLGLAITKVPCFIQHIVERGLLVLGFSSGTLRVLDVGGGGVLAALPHGEGNRVTSFELLPELDVALTTTARGHLYLWDLRTEQPLDKFVIHRGGVFACRTGHHGRYLLTTGGDGIVRFWETSWTAGEVRGADSDVPWLSQHSQSKRRAGLGKLLSLGGTIGNPG